MKFATIFVFFFVILLSFSASGESLESEFYSKITETFSDSAKVMDKPVQIAAYAPIPMRRNLTTPASKVVTFSVLR